MLIRVVIPTYIYHLIVSHALSTEKEEIIGILIGDWQELPKTNPFAPVRKIARVAAVALLTRSDKRKDRVEIAPEQLHLAALYAEEASKKLGQNLCVVGWYHSHPHITVSPSVVDLKTQHAQQYMDPCFFGLIVSCFDKGPDMTDRIQITCFQAGGTPPQLSRTSIPLEVIPSPYMSAGLQDTFLSLPSKLHQEFLAEYEASIQKMSFANNRRVGMPGDLSLGERMTRMHNASVYGQNITNLVDGTICPMTQLLQLKTIWLSQKIEALQIKRDKLLRQRPLEDLIDL